MFHSALNFGRALTLKEVRSALATSGANFI
jgi:hypothetical protein